MGIFDPQLNDWLQRADVPADVKNGLKEINKLLDEKDRALELIMLGKDLAIQALRPRASVDKRGRDPDILRGMTQIANAIGVSRATAHRYAVSGKIRTTRCGSNGAVFASLREIREDLGLDAS